MIEYKPISQIIPGGAVEFSLTAPTFVDLHRSKLRLKVRLENGDGTEIGIADLTKNPKENETLDPSISLDVVSSGFHSLHAEHHDYSVHQWLCVQELC